MVFSNDFSAFALFTAGLATLVSGFSKPVGDSPIGNSIIKPGLGDIANAGSPYQIQWQPSTPGTVSLYLCIGPSTNCVAQDTPFADHVANSGSYSWIPSTLLTPGASGYGILLVCDEGPNYGQYQYSPQFGVAGPQSMSRYGGDTNFAIAPTYATSTDCNSTDVAAPTGNATTTYSPVLSTAYSSDVAQNTSSVTFVSPTLYPSAGSPTTYTQPSQTNSAGALTVGLGGAVLAAIAAALAM